MRIVQLTAENVKRLQAVSIKPDGSVVEITGRNGQGKTSILDAISMALGGKSEIPGKPIRNGERSAQVILDLGEITVTRHWTSDEKTYLRIESKDGKPVSSPQQLLDSLTGQLTFDPLRFCRMKPADQLDTLCRLAGIDRQANARKRADIYSERTTVNRHIKELRATLAQNKPQENLPDKPVDVADLMSALKDVNNWNRARDQLIADRDRYHQSIIRVQSSIEKLKAQIAELQTQLEEQEESLSDLQQHRGTLAHIKPAESTEELEQAIADAGRINEAIAAAKRYEQMARELKHQEAHSEDLTDELAQLQRDELAAIEAAQLPISGLGLGAEGVMLNGLPFEQASAAEQLRTSIAMAIAMNPKLRIMLIRDGSLLDEDSMDILRQMAEDSDTQIWIERVSDGENVGVVIEDGQVVPTCKPAEAVA